MLSYTVDGPILTIVATGTPMAADREAMFDAIAADPRVPARALGLVDVTRSDPPKSIDNVQERAHRLVTMLGPKLGPVCAVVAPPRLTNDAAYFQAASGQYSLRVEVFADEEAARRWLEAYARQS